MATELGSLAVSLSLNADAFNGTISQVNQKMKAMGNELKAVQAKGKDFEQSIDGLTQKQDILQRSFDASSVKLQEQRRRYDELVASGKASEAQLNRAANEVNKAQVEYNKLESQLKQVSNELDKQNSKWNQAGQSLESAGGKLQSIGGKLTGIGTTLTASVTAPIVAMGAASVKTAMDFEAQMDRVGAIAGATAKDMQALTDTALELGASTSKSASEVAIGMENMAAMGFTANEIMAAMPGIISAAEASGSDMAQTADVVSSSLNIFGMKATEASRVADILAQTANQSAADITDMQYALKYAGPPAAALGVSMEELSASIGIMTNAGMKGEQAGTTLRSALLSLLDPSEENSKLMNKMGIEITDAQGNFVGLANLVDNLSKSMAGQTETQKAATLSALVGKEAVSGMLSLMSAGPTEIDKMTVALKNSGGASAEAAAKMKDNLKGTLDELMGTIETAAITIGTALSPAIEKIAEVIQKLVEKFQNLSAFMQGVSIVIAGIAAAIGPVILAVGLFANAIGSIMTLLAPLMTAIANAGGLMAFLSSSLASLGTFFTALTGPIGITIAAVVAIGAGLVLAYQKVEWFRDGVNQVWETIKSVTSTVFNGIKSVINTIMQGVMGTVKGILDSLKAFWEENGKTISSIVKFYFTAIKANIEVALNAIKAIFSVVFPIISGIVKIAFGLVQMTVKNVMAIILGVIQTVLKLLQGDWKGAWETIKKTAETIMKNIIGFFRGINLRQIGKDIIQGLINGIGGMASTVAEKAREIASSLPKWMKKVLGIKSPSRVMMAVGKDTVDGLVLGLSQNQKFVDGAMQAITTRMLNITKQYSVENKKINSEAKVEIAEIQKRAAEDIEKIELNAAERKRKLTQSEILRIKRIKEDSAKEIINIQKKEKENTSKLLEQEQKDKLEMIKNYIDNKKSLEQMSVVEEAAIWQKSVGLFKVGTEERIKAQNAYKDALEAVNTEIVSINEQYSSEIQRINDDLKNQEEQLTKAYDDAVSNREKSLLSFSGLFESFTIEMKTSGGELLSNLQSQVDGFKIWQAEMDKLSAKGIDQSLLDELRALGPDAVGEIQALNSLSEPELQKYSDLYKEKAALAREQAVTELSGMKTDTEQKIQELREAANAKLDTVKIEWTNKIKALTGATSTELSSLQQIGIDAGTGLLNGLASMQDPLITKATEIANAIKSTIQSALDIHSPSRVMRGFGINIGQGLVLGMDDMVGKVAGAAQRLATTVAGNIATSTATSNSYDYSKNFAPSVQIYTSDSGDKAMERTLRRLAYQF